MTFSVIFLSSAQRDCGLNELYIDVPLAQLAEHLTFNQRVRSSSLRWHTKNTESYNVRLRVFLLRHRLERCRKSLCDLRVANFANANVSICFAKTVPHTQNAVQAHNNAKSGNNAQNENILSKQVDKIPCRC